jgi:hypothetical protein
MSTSRRCRRSGWGTRVRQRSRRSTGSSGTRRSSHPHTKERAGLIEGVLAAAGIRVDRGIEREVSNAFPITAQTAQKDGREVGEVILNGQLLFRAAVAAEGRSPAQPAGAIAAVLRRLLGENLMLHQVRLSADGTAVLAAGVPLIQVLPGDAELAGTPVPELARQALVVLQRAFWQEELNREP